MSGLPRVCIQPRKRSGTRTRSIKMGYGVHAISSSRRERQSRRRSGRIARGFRGRNHFRAFAAGVYHRRWLPRVIRPHLPQSRARGFMMSIRQRLRVAGGLSAVVAMLVGPDARGGTSRRPPTRSPRPRDRMVQRHLVERGIKDPRVLEAFRTVPRHRFVPPRSQRLAYEDESIPIGEGQTITPPFDVAFMTEALRAQADRPGLRGRHRLGLPGVDPVAAGQGGLLGRDPRAPGQAGRRGHQGARLHQHPHPRRRRLRRLARGRPVRRDHRHLRPETSRRRWSSSSRRAAGWSSRWATGSTRRST